LSEKGYKVKRIMSGKGKQSPDADIELEKNNEKIAEVKYFKDTPKFYLGLDEALALLLHGYDKVYLLHVFDTALSDKCENHVSKALAIINLTPISYMFMISALPSKCTSTSGEASHFVMSNAEKTAMPSARMPQ